MIASVTGGTGFVGRRLVERLRQGGARVRILSRGNLKLPAQEGCEIAAADLGDPLASLDGFVQDAQVLYHCAAELRNESVMASLHVEGTRRLVSAAEGKIQHWVQLSSVGVYGPRSEGVITEETPEAPMGIYERTKAESDAIVRDAALRGAFSLTVLRPAIVFGEDMPNPSLRAWVEAVRKGRFFYIGAPGAMVNYTHVDNVVQALLVCGSDPRARGRVYNLADPCTIEEFVGFICAALERPPVQRRLPAWLVWPAAWIGTLIPGFPLTGPRLRTLTGRVCYPATRIIRELEYSDVVSLEAGLLRLVKTMQP